MTIDKAKLKALAENTKGWDKLSECWPSGESEPDWEVGAVQDGERYPVLTINTEQYDADSDAVKLAQYYAAANPKAILALLAEIDQLKEEVDALKNSNLWWVTEPGNGLVRCVTDERYRKFSASVRAKYSPVISAG